MFLLMRDPYHGGGCGSPRNIRFRVSIVHCTMKRSHSKLGKVDTNCEVYKGTTLYQTKSIYLLGPDSKGLLKTSAEDIEINHLFGERMWPPVQNK